jgi:hypothetical protein
MRVLYGAFYYDNLWKIAQNLQEKHQWEPVYWFGSDREKNAVQQAFPSIVYQDYIKARRALHSNALKDLPGEPIDKALIDALAAYQANSMKIIYRCDTNGTNFTHLDLQDTYYRLIRFWLTVIKELKIELVVFWVNPHGVEYVLYSLCKLLKIPIVYLDCAYCITKDTHLISASLENRSELLDRAYNQNKESHSPLPATIHRIAEQRGDYTAGRPDFMTEPALWKTQGDYFKKFISEGKEFVSLLMRGPFKKKIDHFKFHPGSYANEEKTSGTLLEHYLFRRRILSIGEKYKKIYDKYVTEVDFNRPFVYFAAPFQPEGTTMPDAGAYESRVLVLEMLQQAVPKDWLIFYKEHPSTFDSTINGNLYRSEEFYQRVASLPNVRFVNYKIDSFELIDRSKAVVTPTGSVGWEGLVRGKPCIIFGQVWYRPCHGVFPVESYQDLKNAVDSIHSGFIISQNEIMRFAGIVDRYCQKIKFRHIQSRFGEIENLDLELSNYAEAFYKSYRLYYS